MRLNQTLNFLLIFTFLLSIGFNSSFVLAAEENQPSTQTAEATQETPAAEVTQETQINTIPDEEATDTLDKQLASINRQREIIASLLPRIKKSEGLLKTALEARLDKALITLLELGIDFSKNVVAQEEQGVDVSDYREQAIDMLIKQLDVATQTAARIRTQIEVYEPDLSAAEQAASNTKIFAALDRLNNAYEKMVENIEYSKRFEVDVTEQETALKESLADRAANGSILLDLAMNEVAALRASVSAVPDDTELKAKLTVAGDVVRNLANGLATVLTLMDSLEMDTTEYREQVLGATGEITTDVFEIGVVTKLLQGWGEQILTVILEDGPDLFFKTLLFFLIIFVFRKLANLVQKIIERGLNKANLRLSQLLRRMIVSIARNIVIVLGILIALSQVGISLGPLLAGLGVVGFVVGFALQDTLSNFASGLMILIYRPFDVGDVIEAGGVFGNVSHMSLVNTTIMTFDNQTIVVPNNKIWGDVIKNVTTQNIRRVDLVFGISYSDDIPKTEQVLQEIVETHDKVLTDPELVIKLHELADSSVNFVVRPWVKTDDYWDVYWDITREVKMRFDKEGISIPFPQRDVHLYNETAT